MSTLVFSASIYMHVSLRKPINPKRNLKPKKIKR